MQRMSIVMAAGVCLWLAGCASPPGTKGTTAPGAVGLSPAQRSAARSVAVCTRDGRTTAFGTLVQAAATAEVVILGEQHGAEPGLSAAATVFSDLALAEGAQPALALEFFERDEQPRLDEYLSGMTTEEQFLRRTGRSAGGEGGGNYPPAHREMVETAKGNGWPVVAANAPRPMVRLARTKGFDALREAPASLRPLARVPEEPLPEGRYREKFFELMGGGGAHGPESSQAAAMFRSQLVWDWTMAESVVRAVEAGRRPVVLVVGQFHSDFEGGLVQALRRLRPDTRVLTVSFQNEAAGWREEDRDRADFVVYRGEVPATAAGAGGTE